MSESQDVNIDVLNREIIDAISGADEGNIKSASTAGSNMIRRRIREDGFARNIITPKTVTNDMLDRVPEHDRPVMIEDMEPDSKGAKSIPFGDSADTEFYYGTKYLCVFNAITTPEFTKDINELRTYKMDLRRVITDNALRDIQTEEDTRFIEVINTVTGAFPGAVAGTQNGQAGHQQAYHYAKNGTSGNIGRQEYVECLSSLENQNLNNGVFLMNRKTAKEFLKMDRSEAGGDLSQELFTSGLKALSEATVFGVRHLFTIKADLVPNDEVYHFAEPEFLGRFYTLQDPTMYVEKKKDILRFSARETISVTIANLSGVARSKWS
jgi:HK97 family phage major capsid protein